MGQPRFARQTTTSNLLQRGSRRPPLPYKEAAGIIPSSLPPSRPARRFSGLGLEERALYASLPRALSKHRDLNRTKPSVLACLWPLPTTATQPWPSPPRVCDPSSSHTGENPHRRHRKKKKEPSNPRQRGLGTSQGPGAAPAGWGRQRREEVSPTEQLEELRGGRPQAGDRGGGREGAGSRAHPAERPRRGAARNPAWGTRHWRRGHGWGTLSSRQQNPRDRKRRRGGDGGDRNLCPVGALASFPAREHP